MVGLRLSDKALTVPHSILGGLKKFVRYMLYYPSCVELQRQTGRSRLVMWLAEEDMQGSSSSRLLIKSIS
jgi:hypothetical protein